MILFDEKSGRLTEKGFTKVCECISESVVEDIACRKCDFGKVSGEVPATSGQAVSYCVHYSIHDKGGISLQYRDLSGYRLEDGDIACDMPIDSEDKWSVMWATSRIVTEELQKITNINEL